MCDYITQIYEYYVYISFGRLVSFSVGRTTNKIVNGTILKDKSSLDTGCESVKDYSFECTDDTALHHLHIATKSARRLHKKTSLLVVS